MKLTQVVKRTMCSLGGLRLTVPAGDGGVFLSDDFADKTALSILHLLQLDKSPVALCNELHEEAARVCSRKVRTEVLDTEYSSDTESRGERAKDVYSCMCLIPLATKINIFTSCGVPQDTRAIEEALVADAEASTAAADGVGIYEAWEARYMAATLAFSIFDFVRCAELSAEAVTKEPRDAFSARLLFISAFNCGRSGVMADALASAIAALPPMPPRLSSFLQSFSEKGESGTDPEADSAEVANRGAFESFAARPYYHALLCFGMNEAGIGGHAAMHHAEKAIALAKAYNAVGYLGEKWIHPFAVHTICHLFSSTPFEGLRLIDEVIPRELWEASPYFACHLFYHMITMYIDTNQHEKAIELYDNKLAPLVVIGDMYSVADASSIVGRFIIADMLPFSDPRPLQATDMWLKALRSHGNAYLHKMPFFTMNVVTTAALCRAFFGDAEVRRLENNSKWRNHSNNKPLSTSCSDSPPKKEQLEKRTSADVSSSEQGRKKAEELSAMARIALAETSEPFRSIFSAVLDCDDVAMLATKAHWVSVGGSRGQVDILERFRVWALGLHSPSEAASELQKASVLAPHAPYYSVAAQKYKQISESNQTQKEKIKL